MRCSLFTCDSCLSPRRLERCSLFVLLLLSLRHPVRCPFLCAVAFCARVVPCHPAVCNNPLQLQSPVPSNNIRYSVVTAAPPAAPPAAGAEDGAAAAAAAARGAHPLPPLRRQVRALFKRSWRQVTRDKAAIKLRIFSNVQSAVVFGVIWWRLRRVQTAVSSRLGLLQVRPASPLP